MKKRHIWISAAAIAVIVFLFSQDALARLAWQKYHRPDAALMLNRHDAALAMQLGNYYFNGGAYDLTKAESAFRQAVSINPKILWGHYQIGRILFVRGDNDGAIAEVNKELAANPENLRSLYVRGLIYGYRSQPGDLEKAETDFRRFTKWAPKEWAGYNDLAWILSKEAKYGEAKEVGFEALEKVPDAEKNPWLWNSLGVAELNLGEYREAARSFTKAKTLSEGLTLRDWQSSYPGNSPQGAESGLSAFRQAIEENLKRAEHVNNSF